MKKILIYSTAIIGLGILLHSCKKKDYPITKITPTDLDSIAANYYEQYLKLHPLEATAQGDNRYNDQLLINIDKDYISQEIAFYKSVDDQLKKVNYENLSDDKKVVFDVLDFTLKDKIESYAYHPEYFPFTQFGGLPLELPVMGSGEGIQPFKTVKDYENWLKRLDKFPAWADQAIKNFDEGIAAKTVLPKTLVLKMITQMKAEELTSTDISKNIFYGPIRLLPKSFSGEDQNKLADLYQKSIKEKISPTYQKLAKYLEETYLPKARTTSGYNALPNGENTYKYFVKSYTTTDKTAEEINQLGLDQVAMLRAEMTKIQQLLGKSGSLEDFIRSVTQEPKAMPYKTSTEVLAAFNSILTKITPQLKTMFNVMPKTPFEIRQTEKFREATASAEYIPGSADGKRPGIFYVPLPDPQKFNVASGMESLFLHEAIPGHHYQISLQQENTKLPKFMRFYWLGAYGEGWAHYCETLGPEFGLYTDPYQKMGYLSDQMLRAVRLVVDTGLHTGKMTREEAITYFMNNIAYDEAAATAEIERYMAIPGQALGYKIGSLKIRELRELYQKTLGSKFNLANFHDEILSQGCLPLSILDLKMKNWAKTQK